MKRIEVDKQTHIRYLLRTDGFLFLSVYKEEGKTLHYQHQIVDIDQHILVATEVVAITLQYMEMLNGHEDSLDEWAEEIVENAEVDKDHEY